WVLTWRFAVFTGVKGGTHPVGTGFHLDLSTSSEPTSSSATTPLSQGLVNLEMSSYLYGYNLSLTILTPSPVDGVSSEIRGGDVWGSRGGEYALGRP
ncbi:MAG TPA: hypothetical protein VJN44_01740, partial [Roseateles sp.]|nr:hypothetical protein [Roseateles sp.]